MLRPPAPTQPLQDEMFPVWSQDFWLQSGRPGLRTVGSPGLSRLSPTTESRGAPPAGG